MNWSKVQDLGGGRARGVLPTGRDRGIALWSIRGSRPGPTLVLTAGVHGCEYVGVVTLRRLFEQLKPEELAGRVLLLPLVNPSGFYAGAKQVVPEDGKNLNRVFPAPENGTASERIARAVQDHIYPEVDFLLDLHGGDANEAMMPLVFFPADAALTVTAAARECARHLEVDCRIPSTARDGLYSCAARQGIPALLLEMGGQGLWTEELVERELRSIRSLMARLGMGGMPRIWERQREAAETRYVTACSDGLWFPRVKPGQPVEKGETLGVLEDLDGVPLQTVQAEWDGVVWYHTVALGVSAREALVAYGRWV